MKQRTKGWPGGRAWAREGRADRVNGPTARMWKVVRIKRQFTIGDLASIASVRMLAAYRYVLGLKKAGIVRLVQRRNANIPSSVNVYRLAQDLGRFPPRVLRNGGIFDPNTRNLLQAAGGER